jgi:hypothetical protein
MPYIKPTHRAVLDVPIDILARRLVQEAKMYGTPTAFAGLLNYACTRLTMRVIHYSFNGKMKYWLIAIITGIFKNISDEFYRRLAGPYEDEQKEKNGDIPEYKCSNVVRVRKPLESCIYGPDIYICEDK